MVSDAKGRSRASLGDGRVSRRYCASYAPVTVLIDQWPDRVYLSYDQVGSFLAPYGNAEASAVARQLDDKIVELLTAVAE